MKFNITKPGCGSGILVSVSDKELAVIDALISLSIRHDLFEAGIFKKTAKSMQKDFDKEFPNVPKTKKTK